MNPKVYQRMEIPWDVIVMVETLILYLVQFLTEPAQFRSTEGRAPFDLGDWPPIRQVAAERCSRLCRNLAGTTTSWGCLFPGDVVASGKSPVHWYAEMQVYRRVLGGVY